MKLDNKKIAYIEAMWHEDIVEQAKNSFISELESKGLSKDQIDFYKVPGSLEIPLQAKLLAESNNYSIIIAAGLIVNGGIYRHEFVADAVISGMMKVQLETNVPVLSVVLTPLNFHESKEHHNFFYEHFKVKGKEAASACIKTLDNLSKIRN